MLQQGKSGTYAVVIASAQRTEDRGFDLSVCKEIISIFIRILFIVFSEYETVRV
jgi:hypothetical protein